MLVAVSRLRLKLAGVGVAAQESASSYGSSCDGGSSRRGPATAAPNRRATRCATTSAVAAIAVAWPLARRITAFALVATLRLWDGLALAEVFLQPLPLGAIFQPDIREGCGRKIFASTKVSAKVKRPAHATIAVARIQAISARFRITLGLFPTRHRQHRRDSRQQSLSDLGVLT